VVTIGAKKEVRQQSEVPQHLTAMLNELKRRVHHRLLSDTPFTVLQRMNQQQLAERIASLTEAVAEEGQFSLTGRMRQELEKAVMDEVAGYGPIQSLLEDETVTEIMVNGPKQVYIERDGHLQLTECTFEDDAHVMRTIEKIIAPLGRRLDESMPMVDARLPDGSRVNAIIPPLAVRGPCLTIRKFPHNPLTPDDLVKLGTLSEEMRAFLAGCVEARLNIMVSGGTGSGKTTTLTAERGGEGRDNHPATGAQLVADATGPDNHRRMSRCRGARYAAGDEHGSRRFAVHTARQQPAGRTVAA